ncbi:PEGA domain-containing protein [Candidatus Woesebacteria bacterium]|nr:PEGA domain-containing protein [Candidatus Woesebacteria bacterium]
MTKIRILIFLLTIIVVATVGTFVSYYARGYRFDTKNLRFVPNGLLVLKSDPDGASVYVNQELRAATNSTISLLPGTYDVSIKKDGYFTWSKRLEIQKEIVTEADVNLFRSAPSLTPITFDGAINPTISSDLTKVAFTIVPSPNLSDDKVGLWVLDTLNLPLGFPRDPKRITDGDLTGAQYLFSPDTRQILLTTKQGVYLLDSGSFTPQNQRVNIASTKDVTLATWEKRKKLKLTGLINSLPVEAIDLFNRKSSDVLFSPDETKILYTASSEATLKDDLIPQLPGASTQKQERNIQKGSTYVYDIKEDRNFLITDKPAALDGQLTTNQTTLLPTLHWFPSSNHLVLAQDSKVSILEYDGTNSVTVYAGTYNFPSAYPYLNTNKLLILTNLGAINSPPNLYSLTLK